jgi:uncharacterized protein YndB with AHSA1/START domain
MHETASKSAKPEIRLSRVFDAPRRLVFEAWTTAEHLSRWFAPRPLTVPTCDLDFRPGGAFRLTMRTPDGIDFPMECTFREVVTPERIVFAGVIHGGVEVVTTVTFSENAGKTTLNVHQTFSMESDATRGAPQGWALTLDQLGEYAATLARGN